MCCIYRGSDLFMYSERKLFIGLLKCSIVVCPKTVSTRVCVCVCVFDTCVCEFLSLAMGYITPRLTVVKPAFGPWQCSRAVKCSPKSCCWAQLQLSTWKDAHPAHIPDSTDICHTPCPSYTGEPSTKAVARFLLDKRSSSPTKCKEPRRKVVLQQEPHSMHK